MFQGGITVVNTGFLFLEYPAYLEGNFLTFIESQVILDLRLSEKHKKKIQYAYI